MHSISWGCPKIVRHCDPISLLINTFGIHLEPEYKSHEQIIHYRAEKKNKKKSKNKRQFCSIFRRFLIKSSRKDFLWSDLLTQNTFFLFTTKCRFLAFSAFLTSVWSVIRVWVPYVQRYSPSNTPTLNRETPWRFTNLYRRRQTYSHNSSSGSSCSHLLFVQEIAGCV